MAGNYEKGMYNQLVEMMERMDAFEDKYRHDTSKLNGEIFQLKAENQLLHKENQLLRDDNARLKSIINNDSSNTSLPPSSDFKNGKSSNTYNGREKTNRKAGGQSGHKGTTLTKAAVEEKIKSGRCRHEIREIGDPSTSNYITRYVLDLDVAALITEIRIYADANGCFSIPPEYRSDVIYGSNVKALAVTLYSEGVMSNDRIAAFLNAASNEGLGLSDGSIYHFCKNLSAKAQTSMEHLETELLNRAVVSTDATVVTVNGKQNYIRNFSVDNTVVYHAMSEKTIESMGKLNFFKKYTGTLMHDHETALYHFGTAHAECNVHIIRYLRKNTEETGHKWSGRMITLLCGINKARKELMAKGAAGFPCDIISSYEKEYLELIAHGREENKTAGHRYAKRDEKTLINRMEKYSKNHLLFVHDFAVPFDDNMSERDLRKAKNRQKMAGGFRKESGNEMYCAILTIVETLKRRKMAILENIRKLFSGTPAIF